MVHVPCRKCESQFVPVESRISYATSVSLRSEFEQVITYLEKSKKKRCP